MKARFVAAGTILFVAASWMSGPLPVRWPGALALGLVALVVAMGLWRAWWPEALAGAGVLVALTGSEFLVLGGALVVPFGAVVAGRVWRSVKLSVIRSAGSGK